MNITEARRQAKRLYASKRFQRAYVDGARAALAGRDTKACPYAPETGRRTWRTTYRRVWLHGHSSASTASE